MLNSSRPFTDSPSPAWLKSFRERLLRWFVAHRRDLPWRKTRDPYAIWVSEVMLQQTQVATVEAYFSRFLASFPTIAALAAADEQQVLRHWEGLGYYRRARQLHRAAQVVVAEHGGVFPREIDVVRSLPGIGRYTAGAILSIAHDDPHPILEANTFRLLARLLAYRDDPRSNAGQTRLWSFAEQLLPKRDVGAFNQALMELGALICTPRAPRCDECSVAQLCPTRAQGLQAEIPPPVRKVAFESVRAAAVVVEKDDTVLVVCNPAGERWAGMWDFPRFELRGEGPTTVEQELAAQVAERTGIKVRLQRSFATLKHGVTRYRITLDAWLATARGGRLARNAWSPRWVTMDELHELPLSTTARKIAKLIAAMR
ncbi:MAG: A/G-specific adenine glycosylase [Planctomycetaceae bacterium]|nr:A/G-specific adenine glycosylase [Planctomycetaceae bacterium]